MRFYVCRARERVLVLGLLCIFLLPAAALAQTNADDTWEIAITPRQVPTDSTELELAEGLTVPSVDAAILQEVEVSQRGSMVNVPETNWSIAIRPLPASRQAARMAPTPNNEIAEAAQPRFDGAEDVPVIEEIEEPAVVDVDAKDYESVYRSIPFSRAEYNANPSYRHDSTMEILFGQLRPMTIIKERPEAQPMGMGFYRAGPYYNFQSMPYYGYGGLPHSNSLNFWYPIPRVYRHW